MLRLKGAARFALQQQQQRRQPARAPFSAAHRRTLCRASQDETETDQQPPSSAPSQSAKDDSPLTGVLANVGTVIAYGVLLYYAFAMSPNQTPLRDGYFLEKLVGLGVEDGVPINPILFSVFMLMGVHPIIFASLMVPAARSSNKVPLFPFVGASFAAGIFALFPYLCLWQPIPGKTAPPDEQDLQEGWGKWGLKLTESPWFQLSNLLFTGYLLYNMFSADVRDWNAYFNFFDESRFIHVTTIDFCALTAMTPFFLWWDADKRRWGPRNVGVPLLSVLPLIGPLIYLIVRPKATSDKA